MTQEKLPELTGLGIPYLNGLENGKHDPSFRSVIKIAEAFGLTAADLTKGYRADL
jgi:transcriptional regulator with XRE-family HTH domain